MARTSKAAKPRGDAIDAVVDAESTRAAYAAAGNRFPWSRMNRDQRRRWVVRHGLVRSGSPSRPRSRSRSRSPLPSTSRARSPLPSTSRARSPLPSGSRSRSPLPVRARSGSRPRRLPSPILTQGGDSGPAVEDPATTTSLW